MGRSQRPLVETLEAAYAQIDRLFQGIPGAAFVIHEDETITQANREAEELSGYELVDLIAKPFFDLIERPSGWDQGAAVRKVETTLKRADGGRIPVELSSSSRSAVDAGQICVATDISERKALEARVRVQQRLEAIGRLASGVAHEVNSPLQYVLGSLDKVQSRIESLCNERGVLSEEGQRQLDKLPRSAERARQGVERISGVVQAMRRMAHGGQTDPVAFDLNQVVSDTVTVASGGISDRLKLVEQLEEISPVRGWPGEIGQVLLNLIANAAQSMEGEGGTITIRTREADEGLLLEVQDEGAGIQPEHMAQLFEQGFTTKERGMGTGQGLYIARHIMRRHGGDVVAENLVPRGAKFRLCLPRS